MSGDEMPTAVLIASGPSLRTRFVAELADLSVSCATYADVSAFLDDLRCDPPEVVFVALEGPEQIPAELFGSAGGGWPRVVLVGQAAQAAGEDALRSGRAAGLDLPVDRGALQELLRRLREPVGLAAGAEAGWRKEGFHCMVGRSPAMIQLFERMIRVRRSSATVLITGESGSGKELVARTLHALSPRSSGPLVPVNSGAIAPTLVESEFFGHELGSFTGAARTHRGIFERADGGTLFLDEVTEMPPELQVRLLRVLETGRVTRVGGEEDLSVNVRVVAATNRSPLEAVGEGKLRMDLYYRLKVLRLHVPPLRQRREDIPLLVEHFLREIGREEGRRKCLSHAALAVLEKYDWPGNVRELRNAVYTGYLLSDGVEITAESLPPEVTQPDESAYFDGTAVRVRVGGSIEDAERRLILETLAHMGGNKTRAAEVLGISLKTLYNRLHAYGAMPGEGDGATTSG